MKFTMQNSLFSKIAIILIVTFLYVLTGYLGLYFAIPTGYATAIWIGAGIGLGAALTWGLVSLPGVFIGAFIVNFFLTQHIVVNFSLPIIIIIGLIVATGATLQAYVGWWLIKKWIKLDNPLYYPNDILLFAFLSAPVSCLVNATFSNVCLLLFNIIPLDQFLLSWGTWWVGDVLGILIVTPLFLILFGQPQTIWRARMMPILLPLSMSFVLVVILYLIVSETEIQRFNTNFAKTVNEDLLQYESKLIEKPNTPLMISRLNQAFLDMNNYYSIKITDVTTKTNQKQLLNYLNDNAKPAIKKYYLTYNHVIELDGDRWWILATASNTYVNSMFSGAIWFVFVSGLLFCALINIVLFITYGQKKLIQISRDEKAAALEVSEEKNSLILRSAGEGIFGIDTAGRITFVNPTAEKILGYQENELKGKSVHDFVNHHHNPLKEDHCSFYDTVRHDKAIHIANESFIRKNGATFWSEYTSTPIKSHEQTTGAVIVFNDITERKQIELALEKMAHFDFLTSLPNRVFFLEILAKSIRRAKKNQTLLAVCFIDLDNFKQINDSLGHTVGDNALKVFANHLVPRLRKSDVIARLGGDEFALILQNIKSPYDVRFVLESYIKEICTPIKVHGLEINITFSMGIAIYPLMGRSAEELIKNADIAMYRAKELGKNMFVFFDEEINQQIQREQMVDMQLRKALDNQEFHMTYQLQVRTDLKQVIGLEALIRWNNPILGSIEPEEFISIAETNGMIHPLGAWLLEEACRHYQMLSETLRQPSIKLSVNVSVVQLEHINFVNNVKQILTDTKMPGENLTIEITETALMRRPDQIYVVMQQLKALGIQFALDDFGVSYSSMQYLKQLPISAIKIDQLFISDMLINKNDAAIVKAIIQLAHNLEKQCIAEGVETKEQYQFLKTLGCDIIQGYYFAKPMTPQALLNFFK